MTLEAFDDSDFREGYKYELIDGRVYVTYLSELPEDMIEQWLFIKLLAYSALRPDIINHVANKARVFVHRRRRATVPEPDIAAYHDFPHRAPLSELRWRQLSPILVVEVLSRAHAKKDLVRNVELYLQVPSIKEYWVLDGRRNPERPSMRVFRRSRSEWRVRNVAFGDSYTTRLLPGFDLVIDPRS